MNDTVTWWYDLEVLESSLSPLEEGESLSIPDELELFVLIFGVDMTRVVDLNGVINDEVDLTERVDLGSVKSHFLDGGSHGGEINHSWDSCEILQDNSCWLKWNFNLLHSVDLPVKNGFNVGL